MRITEPLIRSWNAMSAIWHSLRYGAPAGRGRPVIFESLTDLSQAVFTGGIDPHSKVSVRGWLSNYTHWYLPRAYSPYRFSTTYGRTADALAVHMNFLPSFLPAGQVRFADQQHALQFLYPLDTVGFTIELSQWDPQGRLLDEPEFSSADDQPWFMNLDTAVGNAGSPQNWSYTIGDPRAFPDGAPDSPSTPGTLASVSDFRRSIAVPPSCRPIPIMVPTSFYSTHQYVDVQAHIELLDGNVLAELATLGAPLSEAVFANCYSPASVPAAFALVVDDAPRSLRHNPTALPDPNLRRKMLTLLVEFCFERQDTGKPVAFGDDEYIDWFIPCVKDYITVLGDAVFPDRWAGKVYGFDGPVYLYKTGPFEIAISPQGLISASTIADLAGNYARPVRLLHDFVQYLTHTMAEHWCTNHSAPVVPRMVYMTDLGWQLGLGPLLQDSQTRTLLSALPDLTADANEIRSVRETDHQSSIAPVRDLFCHPVRRDVSALLSSFETLAHNEDLLPLTERMFDALDYPSWNLHHMRDEGMDVLAYASADPKATVCVQVKSHAEVVDEPSFYEKVIAQRTQADKYHADLYLVLLYANPSSSALKGKKQKPHSAIVGERFAELKPRMETTPYRTNTEVVSPENLAQAILEANDARPGVLE